VYFINLVSYLLDELGDVLYYKYLTLEYIKYKFDLIDIEFSMHLPDTYDSRYVKNMIKIKYINNFNYLANFI